MSVSPVSTVTFAKSATSWKTQWMEAGKTKSPQKQWSDANETFNGHFDRIPPIMIQLYSFVLVLYLQYSSRTVGEEIAGNHM